MLIVIPNASWAHFDGLHKTSLFAHCEPLKQILDRNICFLLKGSKNSEGLHLCTHTHTCVHAHVHTNTNACIHTHRYTHTTNIHNMYTRTHARTVYSDDRVHQQRCAKPVAINAFGSQFWGEPHLFPLTVWWFAQNSGFICGGPGALSEDGQTILSANRRITMLYRFLVLCVMQPG